MRKVGESSGSELHCKNAENRIISIFKDDVSWKLFSWRIFSPTRCLKIKRKSLWSFTLFEGTSLASKMISAPIRFRQHLMIVALVQVDRALILFIVHCNYSPVQQVSILHWKRVVQLLYCEGALSVVQSQFSIWFLKVGCEAMMTGSEEPHCYCLQKTCYF